MGLQPEATQVKMGSQGRPAPKGRARQVQGAHIHCKGCNMDAEPAEASPEGQ